MHCLSPFSLPGMLDDTCFLMCTKCRKHCSWAVAKTGHTVVWNGQQLIRSWLQVQTAPLVLSWAAACLGGKQSPAGWWGKFGAGESHAGSPGLGAGGVLLYSLHLSGIHGKYVCFSRELGFCWNTSTSKTFLPFFSQKHSAFPGFLVQNRKDESLFHHPPKLLRKSWQHPAAGHSKRNSTHSPFPASSD